MFMRTILNSSPIRTVQIKSIRSRHVPNPGTLEQRLFREMCKPVFKPIKIDAGEIALSAMKKVQEKKENNPYRDFLVGKAQEDFFNQMENQMVLVMQPLHYHFRDFLPRKNALFDLGYRFCGFPAAILRRAAISTKWKKFTDHFCFTDEPNVYLVGDPNPISFSKALFIIHKTQHLVLLDYRIMNVDQLKRYSELPCSLDEIQSQTLSLLNDTGTTLATNVNYHSQNLVNTLSSLNSNEK